MQVLVRSPKQLGHGVRRFRKLGKLSQAELGELSRLWQETISKIERDPSSTKFETICSILVALDLELVLQPRQKDAEVKVEDLF